MGCSRRATAGRRLCSLDGVRGEVDARAPEAASWLLPVRVQTLHTGPRANFARARRVQRGPRASPDHCRAVRIEQGLEVGGYDESCFQLAEIYKDPEVRRCGKEWLRAVEQFGADAVDYWNERTSAALERFGLRGDELTFH